MDPSGRFVHGSIAAGKPCPKDARYFMNFINFRSRKLNFINRAKSVLMRSPWVIIESRNQSIDNHRIKFIALIIRNPSNYSLLLEILSN